MQELNNLFSLGNNIRLYVPGTTGVNKKADTTNEVNATLEHFSNLFGGATSYKATGAWKSRELGLVKENVTIVESYATDEQVEAHISTVLLLAKTLKHTLEQEAISLEVNNRLFFV